MDTLAAIRRPIEQDLLQYEEFVRRFFNAETEPLHSILEYVISNRGKGVRPMLVLLAAGMFARNPQAGASHRTLLAASIVEMLHTASLIHDDVIDESNLRRGKPSVNAMWQSRNAVLVGDYILAKTFSNGMHIGQYDIVTHVVGAIGELCEGELMQSAHSRALDMTRDSYLDVIYKKTATLLGISSSVGALTVGASSQQVAEMRRFGDCIGMAFQIKDDILDYTPDAQTGKPSGNDLLEHKITLPMLCVLEECSDEERKQIIEQIRECSTEEQSVALQQMVAERGGIEAAERTMRQYIESATRILSHYPQSEYRDSLMTLCAYIGERNK